MSEERDKIKKGKETRQHILEFVIAYIGTHGYAPTVREIGKAVGLASTSTVHAHLTRMFTEHILETDAEFGSPRAIRVPGYQYVKIDEKEKRESYE